MSFLLSIVIIRSLFSELNNGEDFWKGETFFARLGINLKENVGGCKGLLKPMKYLAMLCEIS
jgi:hypothetical protein